jgi:hypothetical protein
MASTPGYPPPLLACAGYYASHQPAILFLPWSFVSSKTPVLYMGAPCELPKSSIAGQ